MLRTPPAHKATLERLTSVAQALAKRAWARGDIDTLARALTLLQVRAARNADDAVSQAIAEQRITAPPAGVLNPQAFVGTSDGRTTQGLLLQADSQSALSLMAVTQVADMARMAGGVSIASRPGITGYVREVGGACCSRCAILAGAFYRWSEGFERHPGCRCVNVPTSNAGLRQSPEQLFRDGRITDLSKADAQAIRDGADLRQVVNAHRGMSTAQAGRVRFRYTTEGTTARGAAGRRLGNLAKTSGGRYRTSQTQRLMPESIYRLASDRADAIRLLRRFGYIA